MNMQGKLLRRDVKRERLNMHLSKIMPVEVGTSL